MNARELPAGTFYIKKRRNRRKKNFLFRYFTNKALITFLVVFLLVLSFFFASKVFASENTPQRTKTVASVRIERGDSIWSIASSYYTTECGSMMDYVAEIQKSNRLRDDRIHAGAYIIVPYYTSD